MANCFPKTDICLDSGVTMIRRISELETLPLIIQQFVEQLQSIKTQDNNGFSGDIDTSYATRVTMSTDNSIYQALPQGVVFPRNFNDLKLITELANTEQFQSIRFSPRGGGTGTNGQSLTEHMIVDVSRHMREILEINVKERWVKVQAGVIKDQLNDFLRPHGFFFSPDLSTSNRATIGGMVNTDASGQGSLQYGKTSDHVLGLKAMTISGVELNTYSMPIQDAEKIAAGSSPESKIYQQVLSTCRENRDKILSTFPRLNRFLTGYDLEHVFNQDMTHFDLSRVLTGSEGTLTFIAEAKLNITPIAKFKTLINIKYDSFDSALRNSPFLVEANATSVETVDSKVLNLAKQDVIWQSVSDLIQDVPDKEMDGLNIVEFNDEDADKQSQKIDSLTKKLDQLIENNEQGVIGYQVTNDLSAINKIYDMRKKSVGLLGNAKSERKPIAFVEDTAVPPENLADYIADFKALLDSHNLHYGMFGHVDAGVLHVRPALDLCDPEQEKLLRVISDQVVQLTAKYGGLMWGEHGKGYRSEYGPEFFGETLFNELRKIKASFDPNNRLNPGKICTPFDSPETLVTVDDEKRAKFDSQIPIAVKQEFETTVNCNGNGQCFNYDPSSPMCPSYKGSNDRRYSPKGRASIMREWLRLQGYGGDLSTTETQSLLTFPTRLINTIKAKLGQSDFSHEVKESMDACLACKACSTACPIKVDVPSFRSKFIALYHKRYLRPMSDYLVANVELILSKLGSTPKLANALMFNPISNWVTTNVIGYKDAPKFSQSLNKLIKPEHLFNHKEIAGLSEQDKSKYVFIVQDPFTSYYEAELVANTVIALEKLNFKVRLLPFKANGKPQHVKGFLHKFNKTASVATAFFNDISQYNIPMIGLDGSLVFVYREEYVKTLGADKIKFNVQLLSEWLSGISFDDTVKAANKQSYRLLTHCTEKSVLPDVSQQWLQIFNKLNLDIIPVSTGCCGMAGTFGHEGQFQKASKAIYDTSWGPTIESLEGNTVLATGYSCRSQVKRFGEVSLAHPIEIIAKL